MTALRALSPVAAQRRPAAVGDDTQALLLSGAETGELPSVLAHDVGERHAVRPDRLSTHDDLYGVVGDRLARSGSRSRGLCVSLRSVSATWGSRWVIRRLR